MMDAKSSPSSRYCRVQSEPAAPQGFSVVDHSAEENKKLPYEQHDYDDDQDEDDRPSDAASSRSRSSSTFSTVSHDSLPPIHAYGHTFHASRRLYSPNDASESYRMTLQHELYRLCLDGGLTAAKLPALDILPDGETFDILDIGSGTGIWAVEMAQTHPKANILGIELTSALLPSDVPPNLTFEIADAAEEWPDKLYDFIHMRNLVGGGIRDWDKLMRDVFDHLKPGGQLEFTEIRPRFFDVPRETADVPTSLLSEGVQPEIGAGCLEYEQTFGQCCMQMGLNFDPVPGVGPCLSGLGARNVTERVDWLPVKSWGNDPVARRKGDISMEMIDYLENWTLMLFGVCGWKEEDTRALLERVKKEVRDPILRSHTKATFITARRPLHE